METVRESGSVSIYERQRYKEIEREFVGVRACMRDI